MKKILYTLLVGLLTMGLSTIFAPRTRELQNQPEIGTESKHVYDFPGECNPRPRPDEHERLEAIYDLFKKGILEFTVHKLLENNIRLTVTKMCKTDNPFEQQRVDIVFDHILRTSPELIKQITGDGLHLTTEEQIIEFFLGHMSHAQVGRVYTRHVFGYQKDIPDESQNAQYMDLRSQGFIDPYAMMAIILNAQPYFTLRNRHPLVHLDNAIMDRPYLGRLLGIGNEFRITIHTERDGYAYITLKASDDDCISLTFKASLMQQKKLPENRSFDDPRDILDQISYESAHISKDKHTIYEFGPPSFDKVRRNMSLLWRILYFDLYLDLKFQPQPSNVDLLSLLITRNLNQPDEMLQQTLELDILLPILPYMQQIDFDFTLLPINQIYVRHNLPKTTKYKNERLEFPAGATLEYALRLIHELEPYYTAERMPEIIEEQAKYARGQLAL